MSAWQTVSFALLVLCALAMPDARAAEQPAASLYQLEAPLVTQDGQAAGLDLYRGKPVLITMFYASCQATCPLIIDTLRAVERSMDAKQRQELRVLLVTIDPERDTAQALANTARERHLDTSRWTLARTDANHVRQIAAALGVQYRQLPNGQFSHATLLSVLDAQGHIVAQSSELGHADEKLVAALK